MPTHNLMTTAQVAEALLVSRWTVTRWVESGRLAPVHRMPGRNGAMLFDALEVDRLRRRMLLERDHDRAAEAV